MNTCLIDLNALICLRLKIRRVFSIMSLLGDTSRFVLSLGKIMVFLCFAQEGIDGTESKCRAQERV
jgi:hypothetical protein